jgi:hypothetical protein
MLSVCGADYHECGCVRGEHVRHGVSLLYTKGLDVLHTVFFFVQIVRKQTE